MMSAAFLEHSEYIIQQYYFTPFTNFNPLINSFAMYIILSQCQHYHPFMYNTFSTYKGSAESPFYGKSRKLRNHIYILNTPHLLNDLCERSKIKKIEFNLSDLVPSFVSMLLPSTTPLIRVVANRHPSHQIDPPPFQRWL